MDLVTQQTTGAVLSHVEAVYRPNERQLAIDLFKALGCAVSDTGAKGPAGTTYLSIRPDPLGGGHDDVIYVAEMPAEQAQLEEILRHRIEGDQELVAAREVYRGMAGGRPYGLAHIALRYPSFEVLDKVLDAIEGKLTADLKGRVVVKVFRPGDCDEIGADSIQAFVYTDVAVAGVCAFGQIYELAAYRSERVDYGS